jgi:hypothetical protein
METPDRWVILRLSNEKETFFKVLAGWSGSYLEGQSWRINSGITKVETEDDYYLFHGFSGSIYKCHKSGYGMNMIMSGIAANFEGNSNVEIMEDQDFSKLVEG